MSQFVKKASSKIEKLSDEEILRIIDSQNAELRIRNLILDNLIAGCLMVSPQGNILYMNSALKELTALSERKKYTDVNVSRVFLDAEVLAFIRSFISSDKKTDEEFFLEGSGINDRLLLDAAKALLMKQPMDMSALVSELEKNQGWDRFF